ncbi:MAG: symmetrical bis(5'-nucleosyl)-tetraphosphatase [Gammaproteobacteria bacterium]|nr:symmetrical bis(5'-nucleosyl)-tetraphosphatase [Gammaproteobacteria bacterium]
MAVFAIGDVQGCAQALKRLLDRIRFDPDEDRLWFVGDLVNRGPQSLEVMRFVRGLGDRAITVLGNHDLHLLAMAEGIHAPSAELHPLLEAEDAPELLFWLRTRPLLHLDEDLGYVLVHAGLHPHWTLEEAVGYAREVEQTLAGNRYIDLLANMYGNEPAAWSKGLAGPERQRLIINIFTRMRYLGADGSLDFRHNGAPGTQPDGLVPWFEAPGRRNAGEHILFGHWSTLGVIDTPNVYPLDTGCVWGGKLTTLRLDDEGGWFSIPCPQARKPDRR